MGGIVVGGPQGSRAGSRAVPEIAVLNGPWRGSDQIVSELGREMVVVRPFGHSPVFTEGPGRLKRFDFAVANPPFSDKAWTNGLDPAIIMPHARCRARP